eukprot:2619617-Rhodomonas_salina.1
MLLPGSACTTHDECSTEYCAVPGLCPISYAYPHTHSSTVLDGTGFFYIFVSALHYTAEFGIILYHAQAAVRGRGSRVGACVGMLLRRGARAMREPGDVRYQPTRWLCYVPMPLLGYIPILLSAVCLRACYAMSGTDIAYVATCLRALCYYDPLLTLRMVLRACYARCLVLMCLMLLSAYAPAVLSAYDIMIRYWYSVWCYAFARRCPVLR